MVNRVRERLSRLLLHFGAERSLQTRELARRIAGLHPDPPGDHGMHAALSAARAWEAAVLWLGWRLQPRDSVPR